jgi:hypothetical protein
MRGDRVEIRVEAQVEIRIGARIGAQVEVRMSADSRQPAAGDCMAIAAGVGRPGAARKDPCDASPPRRAQCPRRVALLLPGAPLCALLQWPVRHADGLFRASAPVTPRSRDTWRRADSPRNITTQRPQADRSDRAALCAPSLCERATSAIARLFPKVPRASGALVRSRLAADRSSHRDAGCPHRPS